MPERPTQGSAEVSQEKGREEETMAQALNVISMSQGRWAKISRVNIALEKGAAAFSHTGVIPSCLV